MKTFLIDRVGQILLRHNSTDKTVGADIRLVRGRNGVPWAIMGAKPSQNNPEEPAQDTLTRDQCDDEEKVIEFVRALMRRLNAESEWRYGE